MIFCRRHSYCRNPWRPCYAYVHSIYRHRKRNCAEWNTFGSRFFTLSIYVTKFSYKRLQNKAADHMTSQLLLDMTSSELDAFLSYERSFFSLSIESHQIWSLLSVRGMMKIKLVNCMLFLGLQGLLNFVKATSLSSVAFTFKWNWWK